MILNSAPSSKRPPLPLFVCVCVCVCMSEWVDSCLYIHLTNGLSLLWHSTREKLGDQIRATAFAMQDSTRGQASPSSALLGSSTHATKPLPTLPPAVITCKILCSVLYSHAPAPLRLSSP